MSQWKPKLCSDVVATTLNWLWPRYLARGKLALLDGDPEMGKSLLTLDLIARLSRGGPLPDGSVLARPGTSILLSAEDDAGDTIRPRAEAAGADLTRLVLPTFDGRPPRLPEDIPALEQLVRDCGADLVVIDPLMAFLPPQVSANLDQCVRQALTPLADLAARTGCAVLLVRHLTKSGRGVAVRRGQGSMGIVAAVRTAWFAAAHPTDPTARVLTVAKSNVGRRPPALGYRVIETTAGEPALEWTGPVDVTADAACGHVTRLRLRDRATDWLRQELAAGPRPSNDLYAAAAAAGIPERTLDRAKTMLGAVSHQTYDRARKLTVWYWYDPNAPWPQDAPFRKLLPDLLPLDAL